MFSGIITSKQPITELAVHKDGARLSVVFSPALLDGLKIGASVSVSGVCLTVVSIEKEVMSFDLSQETLGLTTLGTLQKGDFVNIERSIKVGDEIGGHIVSGHVHGTAELTEKKENDVWRFRLPGSLKKFVIEKGFIALNGASLTVVDYDRNSGEFSIAFIPETLRITTFGDLQVGEKVNVEVDQQTRAIVETVERMAKIKD